MKISIKVLLSYKQLKFALKKRKTNKVKLSCLYYSVDEFYSYLIRQI